MNQRRAKKDACHVVARLIHSYLDVGQPGNDCLDGIHGWTPKDEKKLTAAFQGLINEMEHRAELPEDEP